MEIWGTLLYTGHLGRVMKIEVMVQGETKWGGGRERSFVLPVKPFLDIL